MYYVPPTEYDRRRWFIDTTVMWKTRGVAQGSASRRRTILTNPVARAGEPNIRGHHVASSV
ncbi:hypothetical protein V8C44DRAFT_335078 [Trichoderma aethiopicum]